MKAIFLILSTFSIVTEAKSFLPTIINSAKPVVIERYQDSVYKVWKTEDFDENELPKQTIQMLQSADNTLRNRFSDIISFNSIAKIQTRHIKESQQKQFYLTLKYDTNNGLKNFYVFFQSLEDQQPKAAAFNFQIELTNPMYMRY